MHTLIRHKHGRTLKTKHGVKTCVDLGWDEHPPHTYITIPPTSSQVSRSGLTAAAAIITYACLYKRCQVGNEFVA